MHNADTTVREKLFTMRMSAEEWERAESISGHYGITVAALVRMLLKERERDLAVHAPAAPKPRKKR